MAPSRGIQVPLKVYINGKLYDKEDAKISVRNTRHESLGKLKAMEKNKEISEDLLTSKEKELQKVVDDYNAKIEESAKKKEKDVMTV